MDLLGDDPIFEAALREEFVDFDVGLPEGFRENTNNNDPETTGARSSSQFSATCDTCKRNYKTLVGYKKHVKQHKMSDAFAGLPSSKALLAENPRFCFEILEDILAVLPNAVHGILLRQLILILKDSDLRNHEQWMIFQCHITDLLMAGLPSAKNSPRRGQIYPLPAEIRTAFTNNAARIIADPVAWMESLQLLQEVVPESDVTLLRRFIPMFIRRLSKKILAFIFSSMKKAAAPTAIVARNRPKTEKELLDLKQVVHYVGGSVIRRVMNRSLRNMKSGDKWECIVSTIRDCFLIANAPLSGIDELTVWTQAQDRGGLLYLNEKAHAFFFNVALLLEEVETPSGSIDFDNVLSKVYVGNTVVIWDDLIRNLPPAVSHMLLDMCVLYFCQTWGVGSKLRRVNQLATTKSSTTKVSLRAGLTR